MTAPHAYIASLPLFRAIATSDLAQLVGRSRPIRVPAGTRIFRAGDPASVAALVISGRLVAGFSSGGEVMVIGDILPGSVTGERALLGRDNRYGADVYAKTDSLCLMLPPRLFADLRASPAIQAIERHLLSTLAWRLRMMNRNLRRLESDREVILPPEPMDLPVLTRPEMLRALSSLCDVPGLDLARLAPIFDEGSLRWCHPGTVLYRQGAQVDGLYFLHAGSVRVSQQSGPGSSQPLTVLQAPAVIGQIGLLANSPRSATCIAHTPVLLHALPGAAVERFVNNSGPLGRAFRWLLIASTSQHLFDCDGVLQEKLVGSYGPPS